MSPSSRTELRRACRAARRRIPANEQRRAAEQVARLLRAWPRASGARRVGGYWPEDGELEPWPVHRDTWLAGGQVYLPCLDPFGSRRLRFRQLQPDIPLAPNRYGIPEPPPAAPAAALWSLDLLLVPLVAFDPQGHRLGMGGGFYDATLQPLRRVPAMHRPVLVGLAHPCQEVAALPATASDVALDWIVTPTGIRPGIGPMAIAGS